MKKLDRPGHEIKAFLPSLAPKSIHVVAAKPQ
jgi:hypothetical protein